MKVLAVLGLKGGAGKTTMALHWAIEPDITGPVMLLDTDPKGVAASWGSARTEPLPLIHKVKAERIGDIVENIRSADAGLCFIDTAPDTESAAVSAASLAGLVVIPTQASARNIEALRPTVEVVQRSGARAVIVLNAIRSLDAMADEARRVMESYEIPICPTTIAFSTDLPDAMASGRGVQEIDPKGKAASDIMAVWYWVKRRL